MAIADSVARLSQFPLFQGFSPDELARIGQNVEERTLWAGQELYRQGELADYLYLVESGEVVEVGRDPGNQVILQRVAEPGDLVGRRSALENSRRMATASARDDTRLVAVSVDNLRLLQSTYPVLAGRLERTDIVNRLMAMPLFAAFDRAQLIQVADLVRPVQYVTGQTIFRRGDLADAMYVIDTGQVIETVEGLIAGRDWPKYLAAGNFIGRHGLRHGSPRRATALAATDVRLYRINRDGFNWLLRLEPAFGQSLTRPDMIGGLRATHMFKELDDGELKHLAGFVGLAHYRPGNIVYRQGETDQTLYMLYKGEALVRSVDVDGRERPRDLLTPFAARGEDSLWLKEPHDETIESVAATDWMYLNRDDLDRFLAERPSVRERLMMPRAARARRVRRDDWMEPDEHILFDERRHWVVLLRRLIAPVLLAMLVFVVPLFPAGNLRTVASIIDLPLLAIGLLWLGWRFIDWRNDRYLVTTKRVIHIEKVLGIRESQLEAPLDKVQNLNLTRDFWGNYFGYGTLLIDTAATFGAARVIFDYLANPDAVEELIHTERNRVQAEARLDVRRKIRGRLTERIGGGDQPIVPRVATAPLDGAPPPPPPQSLWRRLNRVPWRSWLGVEQRTPTEIIWRKHWIRLIARTWAPMVLLPLFLAGLIYYLVRAGADASLVLVVPLVVVIVALGFVAWWGWTNWRNDQYIVSNDRLIDIEKLPLGFSTKRTETTFDKVQNVSYQIPNPLATILDYGTVIIHTAGAQGRLDFQFVPHPRKVQAEIFRRLAAYDEARRRKEREERWSDLPDWFATFMELNRSRGL